jgi:hypothetical protein
MKAANLLIVGLMAGALTGCGAYNYARNVVTPTPGRTVEFVSGSSSSVLIDFRNRPSGEMKFAEAMANDKCAIFGKPSAMLESINTRSDDRMRATYLCK